MNTNTTPQRALWEINDLTEATGSELKRLARPDCPICFGTGVEEWTEWEPYGMTAVPRFCSDICQCAVLAWEAAILEAERNGA